MIRILACFLLIATMASPLAGQPWQQIGRQSSFSEPASWIAAPGVPGDEYGVFHFRRTISITQPPERFIVHVSADNRYRLFVNGRQVFNGPQRSDPLHWRYDTIDLAPYLQSGSNVLAALVWNWGSYRPAAQHTVRTGFLVQGDGQQEAIVNTNASWKVLHNQAYSPIPISVQQVLGYYAAPPGEIVEAGNYPWGWEQPDYSDDTWSSAGVLQPLQLRGSETYGSAFDWQLVPRTIPPMEERQIRYASVRRAEGIAASEDFLRGTGDLVIPARSNVVLLLDQAHLTNAYVVLETSGGAGSSVRLTYAEALRDAQGRKGHRDEIEGKTITGVTDTFRPDGGNHRRFHTLWFRTYRYVQVEIETADQPLQMHDLHGIFTGYPMEDLAGFSSELAWLDDMWEMNWRVARLCAWETYFDTPYYEQLQYVGDTRIQALISLYMSGDDRLVRQAISHFDMSRIPEGITASRYPSDLKQFIPPFSLIWVAMVHDYWMHRDDTAFVYESLPGVRSVLAWFERHLDETGLLGPMPFWNFADWSWPVGTPPGANDGNSIMLSLQFVYALDRAAELEQAFGREGEAERNREMADRIRATIRNSAWNEDRALFADTPDQQSFSQQTNVMAILVNALPESEQQPLMERLLDDTSLTQSTYYYTYYQFEALRKVGLAGRYIEQLAPWQEMLALGLTTTLEEPEPSRSDSHAWSAHPNYGLLATVLGIRPAEPGFRKVLINPVLGSLQRAEGHMPHPAGLIEVKLEQSGENGLKGSVTLPQGLTGVFEWNGHRIDLAPGSQEINF